MNSILPNGALDVKGRSEIGVHFVIAQRIDTSIADSLPYCSLRKKKLKYVRFIRFLLFLFYDNKQSDMQCSMIFIMP